MSFQERCAVFSQTYWAMGHFSQSTWKDECLKNQPWGNQHMGYSDAPLAKLRGLCVIIYEESLA